MEIEKALKILLTPDGKGRKRKASVLRELCDTANANLVRNEIEKFLLNLPQGEKIDVR